MPISTHSLFLDACFKKPTPRAPIWIMRQAGRYLPEYRAVRSQVSFLKLCKTPELAAEVTLQPIDILGVDAAIIFSDILIVPEAMGQTLTLKEKEGPRLFPEIRSAAEIQKLKRPDPEKAYRFLGDAIRLVRKELTGRAPLIGFAGSPWTLMSYMVEGRGSQNFLYLKSLIYQNRALAHRMLKKITQAVTDLLNFQIESGAQAIQIFDTWGGILTPEDYFEFSFPYIQQVIAQLNRKGLPVIFFARGRGDQLESLSKSGADVVSLDWTVDLKQAHRVMHQKVALQGNLDPIVLFSKPAHIRERVQKILQKVNPRRGYIFNLGHGILPNTPVEHVKYLVKTVQSLSR